MKLMRAGNENRREKGEKREKMNMKMGKNSCRKMRLSPPPLTSSQPFFPYHFQCFRFVLFSTFSHTDADTQKKEEGGESEEKREREMLLNVIKCRQMPRCLYNHLH